MKALAHLTVDHAEFHRKKKDLYCPEDECIWLNGLGAAKSKPTMDYTVVADLSDTLRETVGAMVAGLMTDGFDLDQARGIVAGFFASVTKGKSDG